MGPYGNVRTADMFTKAVDPLLFPDYGTIVSKPMDLNMIERRVKSDKYTSVAAFFSDFELIRDNCYLYNTDPENGKEPRLLADILLSNVRYYFEPNIYIYNVSIAY